jgi:hypothetical protein
MTLINQNVFPLREEAFMVCPWPTSTLCVIRAHAAMNAFAHVRVRE